jgi:hypothetical protein
MMMQLHGPALFPVFSRNALKMKTTAVAAHPAMQIFSIFIVPTNG